MKVAFIPVLVVGLLSVGMVGCDRQDAAQTSAASANATPLTKLPPIAVQLKDVADITPAYNVAISYDAAVGQFEPLAKQVTAFADQQTAAFKSALGATPAPVGDAAQRPTLSLYMVSVANAPGLAAVAANGSVYTGKGAATPIVQRWVYLPHTQQVLSQAQLFPGTALTNALKSKGAAGTAAGMEPILDSQGKISEIHFVYVLSAAENADDAVRKIAVPAAQLRGLIAPAYRGLLVSK